MKEWSVNKEYKIGETFIFKDVKLITQKDNSVGSCKGCFFYVNNDCNLIGICPCSRFTRKDKTNVVFVKIEE